MGRKTKAPQRGALKMTNSNPVIPREVRPEREGRIYIRGTRGFLWIAWQDASGHHRESTRSRDPRVADRKLRERLNARDRGEAHLPRVASVTLGALLDKQRDYHELKGTKSRARLAQCADHLRERFGVDRRVARIDYDALEKYVRTRRRGDGAAAGTVRLELWVLRQAFRIGRKYKLVGEPPEFPTVTVKNVRTVHFTDPELAVLLEHLPDPVRAVTEFASMTGWRLMECLTLRWGRVDRGAHVIRLEPGETKNGRGRVFPYRPFPRLAELLERQWQERWRVERKRGVEVPFVFHRDGRPILNLDDAWKAGCRAAGLAGRRFHDLRRYAAMRLVRAGVARSEAMGLMGHETESMFIRYALNDEPGLERAVGKLAALDAGHSEE
jgi:integrase